MFYVHRFPTGYTLSLESEILEVQKELLTRHSWLQKGFKTDGMFYVLKSTGSGETTFVSWGLISDFPIGS